MGKLSSESQEMVDKFYPKGKNDAKRRDMIQSMLALEEEQEKKEKTKHLYLDETLVNMLMYSDKYDVIIKTIEGMSREELLKKERHNKGDVLNLVMELFLKRSIRKEQIAKIKMLAKVIEILIEKNIKLNGSDEYSIKQPPFYEWLYFLRFDYEQEIKDIVLYITELFLKSKARIYNEHEDPPLSYSNLLGVIAEPEIMELFVKYKVPLISDTEKGIFEALLSHPNRYDSFKVVFFNTIDEIQAEDLYNMTTRAIMLYADKPTMGTEKRFLQDIMSVNWYSMLGNKGSNSLWEALQETSYISLEYQIYELIDMMVNAGMQINGLRQEGGSWVHYTVTNTSPYNTMRPEKTYHLLTKYIDDIDLTDDELEACIKSVQIDMENSDKASAILKILMLEL